MTEFLTVEPEKESNSNDVLADATPEIKSLKDIDIALLPVGGTYTMNYKEAADAVNTFKPKIAIPMHYGKIVGSVEDAEKFKELVSESEVVILEPLKK